MKGRARELLGKVARVKWVISILLMIAMLPMVMGCYGNFKLTKSVYRWNGETDTKWGRSGVMLAFLIIPVYEVAAVGDLIILNLAEFWSGGELEISKASLPEGAEVVMEPSADGASALVTIRQDGQVVQQLQFVKVSQDVCEIRGVDGERLGSATWQSDGTLAFVDRDGQVLQTLPAGAFTSL